jgi:hypothetical protein
VEPVYSPNDLAAMTGISHQRIRAAIRKDELPYQRFGTRVKATVSAVLEWAAQFRVEPPKPVAKLRRPTPETKPDPMPAAPLYRNAREAMGKAPRRSANP